MKKNNKSSRREFLAKTGMVTAGLALGAPGLKASIYDRAPGAGEKIRIGFIGVGNRGSELMGEFMKNPNCEVAALCDVYEPYLKRDISAVHPRFLEMGKISWAIPALGETFPNPVAYYKDYRKLLEDKSVDAVVIATPDHWHALQTIHAIQAGKDVYVEKPLTITIHEGRQMVNAQKNSKQVVAVGLNRRGAPVYQQLAKDVSNGKIGKVTRAFACRPSNMYPDGIGRMKPEAPPPGFDWDAWLGPRAYRPYQYNIAPYKFRWWSDFSTQMGNWGVHYMDAIRWLMNETAPVAISAHGGIYAVDDDRDIPDTMEVIYEFASGSIAIFSISEASGGKYIPYGEVELRGTKGILHAGYNGYKITPTKPGQFQTWKTHMEAEEFDFPEGGTQRQNKTLIADFLDCIKSRKSPLCSLEDGHRSTSFAHLANIALATGERLKWDPDKEVFTNSKEANKLLHYEYRKPYKL
jgi:predicted dehydrogenase